MITILVAIVIIPVESNELRDILNQRSIHDGTYRKKKHHVIVAGHLTATSLNDLLKEYYHQVQVYHTLVYLHLHQDRAYFNPPNVVILHPNRPSPEITAILNNPINVDKVFYLTGSPMV
jgi:hypothetical protein